MHHSSVPDPEITEALGDLAEDLGATGLFPGGSLTEFDEGSIRFAVAYAKGKILVDFGKPVAWLGMSPAEAKRFARVLMKLANPITR